MIGSVVKILDPANWRGSIGIVISPFSNDKSTFSWIIKIKNDDVAFYASELQVIKYRNLTAFI